MTQSCVLCHVSGRVQGVFYRGSAQREARGLGLKGFAKNLPDGRVQVLAAGDDDALARFREWLAVGPPSAEVTSVECEPVDKIPPDGFEVR